MHHGRQYSEIRVCSTLLPPPSELWQQRVRAREVLGVLRLGTVLLALLALQPLGRRCHDEEDAGEAKRRGDQTQRTRPQRKAGGGRDGWRATWVFCHASRSL